MTTRGLWVDDAPSAVVKPAWWREFASLGLTDAALMVERSGPGFDERYTDDQLRIAGELSREHDREIGLTIWPEPSREYLAELEQRLPAMLSAAGAAFCDTDLESNWTTRKLRGFASMEEAALELLRVLDAVLRPRDVRLEADTYPGHLEAGPRSLVMPHARRRYPQAYSVRNRDHAGSPFLVEWDDRNLGPGAMQRKAIARVRTIPGDGIVCCGLAAYDQSWPGRSPAAAMRVAYQAAVDAGVPHVRLWSSRWVFGHSKNGYAARFLLEIAEEERQRRAEDNTRPIGR